MDKSFGYFLASQMFIAASLLAPSKSAWLGCMVLAVANIVAMAIYAL